MVGTVSFIWARRMAQITNFDRETFLIHTLELKLWLFEVCIGSHSLVMFAKNFLRVRGINFTGARGTLTTLYQTLCIYTAVWVPACIVWLYYASSSTVWWFSDHFFLISVWSPRKKKKKL